MSIDMEKSQLKNWLLFEIDSYYGNVPNEELPVEFIVGVNLEIPYVMVVEEYFDLPDDYTGVILVDLEDETLDRAIEYVLNPNK